eukprot:GHVU01139548.1.p1 GENE.GHVU01139548.1~~GHVU01139548.1.p1  ORF type:complete len:203 (-),score=13.12 GHVU01139548.1:668-1276(-)
MACFRIRDSPCSDPPPTHTTTFTNRSDNMPVGRTTDPHAPFSAGNENDNAIQEGVAHASEAMVNDQQQMNDVPRAARLGRLNCKAAFTLESNEVAIGGLTEVTSETSEEVGIPRIFHDSPSSVNVDVTLSRSMKREVTSKAGGTGVLGAIPTKRLSARTASARLSFAPTTRKNPPTELREFESGFRRSLECFVPVFQAEMLA